MKNVNIWLDFLNVVKRLRPIAACGTIVCGWDRRFQCARLCRRRVAHDQKGLEPMDPRIERWAKTLVNYCLQVQPGQMVLLISSPVAEPLLAEVYRETLRA